MANVFEAGIESLLSAHEPLSAILREFAEAIDSQDREAGQMIREIADVYSEGEYSRGEMDNDEDEDESSDA